MSTTTTTVMRSAELKKNFEDGLMAIAPGDAAAEKRLRRSLGRKFDEQVDNRADLTSAAKSLLKEAADKFPDSKKRYKRGLIAAKLKEPKDAATGTTTVAHAVPARPQRQTKNLRTRLGDALARTADTVRGESPRRTTYRTPTPAPQSAPRPVQPVPVAPPAPAATVQPVPATAHVASTQPVTPAPAMNMATIALDEPAASEPVSAVPVVDTPQTSAVLVAESYEKDSWLTILLIVVGVIVGFLVALGTFSWVIYEKWDDGNLLRIFAGYVAVVVYFILWPLVLAILGLCIGRIVTNNRVRENRTNGLTQPRQA